MKLAEHAVATAKKPDAESSSYSAYSSDAAK
jgi:hypothetical protein